MTYPEFGRDAADIPVTSEYSLDNLLEDIATQNVLGDMVREERDRRSMSFAAAHVAVQGIKEVMGDGNTYHKGYVEDDGLLVERRAVMQHFVFPGIGQVDRLIVNDEGRDPNNTEQLQLHIRDFMISPIAKAFSSQRTMMARGRTTDGWGKLPPTTGPLLQQRTDRLEILNGKQYGPLLPRIGGGYHMNVLQSRELRSQLDTFAGIVTGLGVSTYEPGFEIPDYF